MTTDTFTTTIEDLVSDSLAADDLFDVYNSFSNLDGEGLLNELLGSDLDTILASLEQAGIGDQAITDVTNVVSDFANTALGYLFGTTGEILTNINGDLTSLTGGSEGDVLINIDQDNFTLQGNGGNDFLFNIGSGNNSLQAGDGDDLITNLGTGNSTIVGGNDNDILFNVGTGDNLLQGGNGDDILINIGNGNNLLEGGNGDDTLINFGSGATLNGGDNSDVLVGGDSSDVLVGGNGDDWLTGGAGADTFELSFGLDLSFSGLNYSLVWTNSGGDIITDFNASEGDIIEIDMTGFLHGISIHSELNFDSGTGELSFNGTQLATLEGVTNFDVSSVVFS